MNALVPPPPTSPSVGQRWQGYVWNGTMWVCDMSQGFAVNVQTFLTPGVFTYMPSPGLVSVTVECIGGGGGGGGVVSGGATWVIGGGGGGSGSYSRKTLPASLVAGGVVVTVAAGGLGAIGGGAAGNAGSSSFGALCIANGGVQAASNDGVNSHGAAGQPGVPGVGDYAVAGNGGIEGSNYLGTVTTVVGAGWDVHGPAGGPGAPGPFGGARREHGPSVGTVQGGGQTQGGGPLGVPAWPNTGAGGTGAASNRTPGGTTANGGDGASGAVICTEYCVGNVTGTCPPPHPPGCGCGCAGFQGWWSGPC